MTVTFAPRVKRLDRSFDELTPDEWEKLGYYNSVTENKELVLA